jgi:sodium/potassium-transporting ATPase subunit beta
MAAPAEKEKTSCLQGLKTSCTNFGTFLYNKKDVNGVETTLVMGRNGNSWAKIGLFYICFYSFLAGFFAAMLAVFLTTINKPGEGGPKLTQYIANKPGLTIVNPLAAGWTKTKGDGKSWNSFENVTQTFLDKYEAKGYGEDECKEENKDGYPDGDKPCKFNYVDALGTKCSKATSYGLSNEQPCILLKMNKVYGWVPSGDDTHLKVECDKDVSVYKKGFLKAAMPFRGQGFYQNPVAVLIMPKLTTALTVRCKLVGPNIEVSTSYNPKRAFGNIEFTVAAPIGAAKVVTEAKKVVTEAPKVVTAAPKVVTAAPTVAPTQAPPAATEAPTNGTTKKK